jgi:hypothetical protein
MTLLLCVGLASAASDAIKRRGERDNGDLMVLVWLIATLVAFSYLGHHNEARYLLPLFPAVFVLIARVLVRIHRVLAAESRPAAIAATLLIAGYPSYQQLNQTRNGIDAKAESYLLNRRIGEWLKENTARDARIFTVEPEICEYYSERASRYYPLEVAEFEAEFGERYADYMVVITGATFQPEYAEAYAQREDLRTSKEFRRGERTLARIIEQPSGPP